MPNECYLNSITPCIGDIVYSSALALHLCRGHNNALTSDIDKITKKIKVHQRYLSVKMPSYTHRRDFALQHFNRKNRNRGY